MRDKRKGIFVCAKQKNRNQINYERILGMCYVIWSDMMHSFGTEEQIQCLFNELLMRWQNKSLDTHLSSSSLPQSLPCTANIEICRYIGIDEWWCATHFVCRKWQNENQINGVSVCVPPACCCVCCVMLDACNVCAKFQFEASENNTCVIYMWQMHANWF